MNTTGINSTNSYNDINWSEIGNIIGDFNAGKTDGTADVSGVPHTGDGSPISSLLGLPPADISADTLMMVMQELRTKMDNLQLSTASENVAVIKEQKKSQADERINQIKDKFDQMKKAEKSGLAGKIFGWIAAVAMVIAGAALLIAGGAGAALLVGGIAMLAVMTLQETGGMEKMINGMAKGLEALGMDAQAAQIMATVITAVIIAGVAIAGGAAAGPAVGVALAAQFGALLFSPDNLTKMGVPEDKAGWVAMGIGIGLALTALGVGIGSAVKGTVEAGTKLTEMAAKIAQNFSQKSLDMIKFAAYIALGLQGAATVGSGASSITAGVYNKQASDTEAKTKELEALLAKLQQMFQDESERIEEIMKRIQEGVGIVMDVLAGSDKVARQMAAV